MKTKNINLIANTIMRILILTLFLSNLGNAQPTANGNDIFWFTIDCTCNGGDVSNEQSAGPFKAWIETNKNTYPLSTSKTNDLVNCSEWSDGRLTLKGTVPKGERYHWLVIENLGSDGFLIDEMWGRIIYEVPETDWFTRYVLGVPTKFEESFKHNYGMDNAYGWCLSTDPNDKNGGWSDNCDACFKRIRIKLYDNLGVYGQN